MDRRLTTILVADIVGFSRQMAADEEGVVTRLRALRAEVIDPRIAAAGGRLIKTMGDGFLIEFPSAVAAVRAALAIQADMRERGTAEPEDRRLRLRMGINVGDIIIDGEDILGDGVNIAARLEPLAPAGGVCISRAVYEQVRGKVDVELTAIGPQRLKNIPEPVDIWHIHVDDTASANALPVADSGASHPATAERPSVAVLPFDNMSADPEQGYFADGITEDIITELSRLPALLVIARNSTFTYKGKATKVQDVCRDLRVRYVLEGSVRKAGQRIRVTAQLIDGGSGGHV
jgi:adenylate cyclase